MRVMALILALCAGSAHAGPGLERLPFQSFAPEWSGLFTVTAVRFDAARREIVWTLEVKADAEPPAFEAAMRDSDGIGLMAAPVKLDAAPGKLKAKQKVRAAVAIGGFDLSEFRTIAVRKAP